MCVQGIHPCVEYNGSCVAVVRVGSGPGCAPCVERAGEQLDPLGLHHLL